MKTALICGVSGAYLAKLLRTEDIVCWARRADAQVANFVESIPGYCLVCDARGCSLKLSARLFMELR